MTTSLYVAPGLPLAVPEPNPVRESIELLRQLVSLHQEQLNLLKMQLASHDQASRWRNFLQRWEQEFPGIGEACKQSLPLLERAYLHLLREMTERLINAEPEEWTDDFVLGEFLDRYGMRLSQLGNIMSQLAPLAEAAGGASERSGGSGAA